MNRERYYVVPEKVLANLLVSEMMCEMNERDGVDNWGWYGSSYEEIVREFYPGEPAEAENMSMWDCAMARLEAGEFQEQVDVQELLGNIFVDMDIIDEQNSYD